MLTIEVFTIFIALCILAPVLGALALLFLLAYENRIDLLEKQKKEMALERDLQEALYNQLNQEIQPHFFFNTLNSMLSLARLGRKEELITGIETFSKLMKHKYTTTDRTLSIGEELDYVDYYLAIQHIRFRDRLEVNWQVASETRSAMTIPYLIQTLVENAFKHAFDKQPGKAVLTIHTERDATHLTIAVTNNLAQPASSNESTGIGLKNLENRLALLFPKDEITFIQRLVDEEMHVTIRYPYQFHEHKEGPRHEHFTR